MAAGDDKRPGFSSGLLVPGNIDVNRRPVTRNPDGSVSTEQSFSFQDDQGREVLIPTIVGGKTLGQDEAKQHYQTTGEHLGIFESPAAADAYAQNLSRRQQRAYNPPSAPRSGGARAAIDSLSSRRVAALPTTWEETFPAMQQDVLVNAMSTSANMLLEDTWDTLLGTVEAQTGKRLPNPRRNPYEYAAGSYTATPREESFGGMPPVTAETAEALAYAQLRELKQANPATTFEPLTPQAIRDQIRQFRAETAGESAEAMATADPLGVIGGLAAGMAQAMADPPVAASMLAGAPAAAGLLRTALLEAGIGGVSETVVQAMVQRQRAEFGEAADFDEAAQQVLLATFGGAVLATTFKATGKALERVYSALSSTPQGRMAQRVVESNAGLRADNPLERSPTGDAEHLQRVMDAEARLRDDTGETPRVPDEPAVKPKNVSKKRRKAKTKTVRDVQEAVVEDAAAVEAAEVGAQLRMVVEERAAAEEAATTTPQQAEAEDLRAQLKLQSDSRLSAVVFGSRPLTAGEVAMTLRQLSRNASPERKARLQRMLRGPAAEQPDIAPEGRWVSTDRAGLIERAKQDGFLREDGTINVADLSAQERRQMVEYLSPDGGLSKEQQRILEDWYAGRQPIYLGDPENPVPVLAPAKARDKSQSLLATVTPISDASQARHADAARAAMDAETQRSVEQAQVAETDRTLAEATQAAPAETGWLANLQQRLRDAGFKLTLPQTVFRGSGRKNIMAAYSDATVLDPSGRPIPVLGKGRYYALDRAEAETFGPNVEEVPIESLVSRPYVISSDDDWRALSKAAGFRYPKFSRDNMSPEEMVARLSQMHDYLHQQGYDGVLVVWDVGEINPQTRSYDELLENRFDKQQLWVAPWAKSAQEAAEAPAAPAAPAAPRGGAEPASAAPAAQEPSPGFTAERDAPAPTPTNIEAPLEAAGERPTLEEEFAAMRLAEAAPETPQAAPVAQAAQAAPQPEAPRITLTKAQAREIAQVLPSMAEELGVSERARGVAPSTQLADAIEATYEGDVRSGGLDVSPATRRSMLKLAKQLRDAAEPAPQPEAARAPDVTEAAAPAVARRSHDEDWQQRVEDLGLQSHSDLPYLDQLEVRAEVDRLLSSGEATPDYSKQWRQGAIEVSKTRRELDSGELGLLASQRAGDSTRRTEQQMKITAVLAKAQKAGMLPAAGKSLVPEAAAPTALKYKPGRFKPEDVALNEKRHGAGHSTFGTDAGTYDVLKGNDGWWFLTYPGRNKADDAYPTKKAAVAAIRQHVAEQKGNSLLGYPDAEKHFQNWLRQYANIADPAERVRAESAMRFYIEQQGPGILETRSYPEILERVDALMADPTTSFAREPAIQRLQREAETAAAAPTAPATPAAEAAVSKPYTSKVRNSNMRRTEVDVRVRGSDKLTVTATRDGAAPKKRDPIWQVERFDRGDIAPEVLERGLTYDEAVQVAKDMLADEIQQAREADVMDLARASAREGVDQGDVDAYLNNLGDTLVEQGLTDPRLRQLAAETFVAEVDKARAENFGVDKADLETTMVAVETEDGVSLMSAQDMVDDINADESALKVLDHCIGIKPKE